MTLDQVAGMSLSFPYSKSTYYQLHFKLAHNLITGNLTYIWPGPDFCGLSKITLELKYMYLLVLSCKEIFHTLLECYKLNMYM